MKVLHVLVNYHPSVGGTQILYKGISENLIKVYNDEVEVYTVNSYYGSHTNQFKKIEKKQELLNGVLITRFPFIRRHKTIFVLINKCFIKLFGKKNNIISQYLVGPWSPSLKKAIINTDADVISASSSGFSYMQYPLYRNKLINPKPFAYQGAIHFGLDANFNPVGSEMLKSILASDVYICNTSYEKSRLVEIGVPSNKIAITGVAVDMESFEVGERAKFRNDLSLHDHNILVGYIGRLEETKNINFLLQAFVKAYDTNNNLKLLLAGYESAYLIKLKASIETLDSKYKKSIIFKHNLSEKDKRDAYHALDIFVLPSYNESFGIVFLEAWSCKKPVIGIDIGAIAAVISNKKDGFLVKHNHENDLAEKINLLANNSILREEFGLNGYNKTKENFTWPIVTHKFREAYLLAIKNFNNV